MRPRSGILLEWSHEWECDREFYISSPTNGTGRGPYIVLGLRPGRKSRRTLNWKLCGTFGTACIMLTVYDRLKLYSVTYYVWFSHVFVVFASECYMCCARTKPTKLQWAFFSICICIHHPHLQSRWNKKFRETWLMKIERVIIGWFFPLGQVWQYCKSLRGYPLII